MMSAGQGQACHQQVVMLTTDMRLAATKFESLEQITQTLQAQVQALQTQIQTLVTKGPGGKSTLDKVLQGFDKTPMLTDDIASKPEKFREWSWKVREHLNRHLNGIGAKLKKIEQWKDPIPWDQIEENIGEAHDDYIYQVLMANTTGQAVNVLRQVTEELGYNCGTETWRRLHKQMDPRTAETTMAERLYINFPGDSKSISAYLNDVESWETRTHALANTHIINNTTTNNLRRTVLALQGS